MNKNRAAFKIGYLTCQVCLASFIVMPVMPGGGSASAAPVPCSGAPPKTASAGGDPGLLQEIWTAAWNRDYIPGSSGMLLFPLTQGQWMVLVSDSSETENPLVDQGFFTETGAGEPLPASSWGQGPLDVAGLLGVDHHLVYGTLQGSTGWEGDIEAMVTEVIAPGENPGDDALLMRVLTPVVGPDEPGGGPQIPDALPLPDEPQEASGQQHPPFTPGGGNPPLTPNCAAIWNVCRNGCWDSYVDDSAACGFIAAGCVAACAIGCAATTFAYGICLAICCAGCLSIEAGCLLSAKSDLDACDTACDIARMTCEPGWVPPGAE